MGWSRWDELPSDREERCGRERDDAEEREYINRKSDPCPPMYCGGALEEQSIIDDLDANIASLKALELEAHKIIIEGKLRIKNAKFLLDNKLKDQSDEDVWKLWLIVRGSI
jgi:hypothetical protein